MKHSARQQVPNKDYIPVIGLEIHIEQNTKSKMFCSCPADHFGQKPNTQTCPICLALPGALPFANDLAIDNTIALALALNCMINTQSKFDRKHYFYPDLPKGYQISQYDLPIGYEGNFQETTIRRIHLEEDTAKSIHDTLETKKVTLIDFNRSGVPLIEIVTEPNFDSSQKVDEFLKKIQLTVRYLNISTADMEKGSMRLEANISLSLKPINPTDSDSLPNYKVELKNINSFKFLKKAIEEEIKRQSEILSAGKTPVQETRGYDETSGKTFTQRTKEDAQDYRYFPEPDIPPLMFSQERIQRILQSLPELPEPKKARFTKEYNLPEEYATILISDQQRSDYFEKIISLVDPKLTSPKFIAGLIINQNLDKKYPEAHQMAKELLTLTKKDYASKSETEEVVNKIIIDNQSIVEKYKAGKTEVIGFLTGQVQKSLQGKADPTLTSQILHAKMVNNAA